MYILLTLSKEGYFYKEVTCVLKSQCSGKNFERSGQKSQRSGPLRYFLLAPTLSHCFEK